MALSKWLRGRLKCATCGQCYHEATLAYDAGTSPNGGMLTLLKKYGPAGYNWSSFPEIRDMVGADLHCPGCGDVYLRIHDQIHWEWKGQSKGQGRDAYLEIYEDHKDEIVREKRTAGLTKAREVKLRMQREAAGEKKAKEAGPKAPQGAAEAAEGER
jgi:hypothetical protein